MALVGWDFPCLVNKFQTKIYGCSPTPKVKIGGFSQLLVLAGKKRLRLELTVHTNFKQNHWIFCTKPNQTKPNLHWWVFIAFYRDSIEQPSIGIAAICWFLKLGRVSFRKAKRRKQAWVKNSNIIQLNLDNFVLVLETGFVIFGSRPWQITEIQGDYSQAAQTVRIR